MAIKDYSTDPDLNVSISGINIAEGCQPSGINNAIRQLMADVKEEKDARDTTQAAKDAAQDAAIAEALDKVGLPLGFEYTRLTGQTAPLGGVDYLGQTATRAMYADLWAWLNEYKPDAIVSESDWQSLYSSQNGNVAKYSTGDGSTTFRFPRVVGYFKGAGSVDELGQYTKEGLPGHTHTRGSMDITAAYRTIISLEGQGGTPSTSGAFSWQDKLEKAATTNATTGSGWWSESRINFDASRSWTGETSQPANSIYGASNHVTPETVTIVMGVIAFGSVASIGEATEEGIVAELGEHGAKLGELEAAIEAFHDNCVGEIFSWPADSEPYRALPINGAAVSRTTYAKLFAKIGTKYGAGDGSTTFNVPNGIGKFLQCDNTAGTVKAAGLPEIAGQTNRVNYDRQNNTSGAFANVTWESSGQAGSWDGDSGGRFHIWLTDFKASRSSGVYGASNTVQPPALTMRYYIKY